MRPGGSTGLFGALAQWAALHPDATMSTAGRRPTRLGEPLPATKPAPSPSRLSPQAPRPRCELAPACRARHPHREYPVHTPEPKPHKQPNSPRPGPTLKISGALDFRHFWIACPVGHPRTSSGVSAPARESCGLALTRRYARCTVGIGADPRYRPHHHGEGWAPHPDATTPTRPARLIGRLPRRPCLTVQAPRPRCELRSRIPGAAPTF